MDRSEESDAQFGSTAVRDDPWSRRNCRRAWRHWYRPLQRAGWDLPFFLVADLGCLLIRPEARLVQAGLPPEYLGSLRRILADPRFQECAQIVLAAASGRQDEAIRTALQSMTKLARGLIDPSLPVNQQQAEVARRMPDGLNHRELGHSVGPVDMIAVRAAARLPNGPKLLDYPLLDECLSPWHRVPEHPLHTRIAPVRRQGEREVSRRAGENTGYTGVRPRLPTDDWIDILPSEWGLVRRGRRLQTDRALRVGLDKILNRQTMVYAKESPFDQVPQLHVLIVFVIDLGASLHLGGARGKGPSEGESARQESARVKALVYRMILDAAEQVPYGEMTIHVAIYEGNIGANRTRSMTCFDLRDMPRVDDSTRQVLRFDEVIPQYFSYSHLRSSPLRPPPGPWPELSRDPFAFLGNGTASNAYTAVLAMLFSQPARWGGVFRSSNVPLRPVEPGRPAVMLVEADLTAAERMYRDCRFVSLAEAAVARAQFRPGGDLDVRNHFLDMLLGPVGRGRQIGLRAAIKVS